MMLLYVYNIAYLSDARDDNIQLDESLLNVGCNINLRKSHNPTCGQTVTTKSDATLSHGSDIVACVCPLLNSHHEKIYLNIY